jgi:hypothetical protein
VALGSEVTVGEGKGERESSEDAETVGRREAEGEAEGELVPRGCTAPAFGPDALVQSAPL